MKVAILGNSHVACLIMAHRQDPSLLGTDIDPVFFAAPGKGMSGMHKTATTTFQQWLYENRDALREKGIFYPDTSEFGVQQRYGHNRLAQRISMEPKEGARVVRKLRRRAAEQVSGDPTC